MRTIENKSFLPGTVSLICVPSVGEVIRNEADAKGEVMICGKQAKKVSA